MLHDQNREKWDDGTYMPLQNVAENQAPFVVIDSILSEEAVLGFEYGYASAEPNTLVIWEAQFGDFVNGAQVVIDQFIASGEVKWGRRQRPDADAAARLRRPGPGALLGAPGALHAAGGRQQHAGRAADHGRADLPPAAPADGAQFRKPLVIMTPKSLLRNKDATSPLSEFTKGEFQTVIGDSDDAIDPKKVKRVIACSGKVYYDLAKKRGASEGRRRRDPARRAALSVPAQGASRPSSRSTRTPNEVVWCQDEPQNQGAWFFVQHYIHENMTEGQKLGYAGRPPSASPAVGYSHLHQEQQKALLDRPSASSRASC